MDEIFIETEGEREELLQDMRQLPLPFSVAVYTKAKRRTQRQNRLQHLWMREVAKIVSDHTGDTQEEVRALCKLTIGVPILRAENEKFRERYDRVIRPLPYQQKLAVMMEPFDLPVTRLMKKEQMSRYLDAVFRHFSEQGIELTQPPDLMDQVAPSKKRRAA